MIAYVDENGVITSTPPELNPNKEEIKQEEILISTPKKENIEILTVLKGRVDYFNESKGYGFIKDLGSGEKYFFHVSNNTLTDISETDIVTFELKNGSSFLMKHKNKKKTISVWKKSWKAFFES